MTITNGYATRAQLKAVMGSATQRDDAIVDAAIEAASRRIDAETGRARYGFTAATVGGTATFCADTAYLCVIDDLYSVTSVKTDEDGDATFETTWAATDYQLEPVGANRGIVVHPWTHLRAVGDRLFPVDREVTVQIVGSWGWSAVPVAIREATIMLAHRLLKRKDSPLGVSTFADLAALNVRSTDPDIAALVAPFRRYDTPRAV